MPKMADSRVEYQQKRPVGSLTCIRVEYEIYWRVISVRWRKKFTTGVEFLISFLSITTQDINEVFSHLKVLDSEIHMVWFHVNFLIFGKYLEMGFHPWQEMAIFSIDFDRLYAIGFIMGFQWKDI